MTIWVWQVILKEQMGNSNDPDFKWRNVNVISSNSFCEEWGEEELSHMAPELIFPNARYLE